MTMIYPSASGGVVCNAQYALDLSIRPPQFIFDLIHNDDGVVSCGHCRQPGSTLRCSRCKCVKYLSRKCQKAHFALHKDNCLAISEQRKMVNYGLSTCAESSTGPFFAVQELTKMGDLLIATAYKESDTVANGVLYYKDALKHYLLPMCIYKNSYHHACSYVLEDQVLLLIVAAGGDDKAIRAWCSEQSSISGVNPNPHEPNRILVDKSPRCDYYEDLSDEQKASDEILSLGVKYRGLAQDDTLFQIIYLFNQMKSLSEYRTDIQRLRVLNESTAEHSAASSFEAVSDALLSYLSCQGERGEEAIVDEIQSTIRAIEYFGKMSFLIHLRDTLPFSGEHAPRLFKNVSAKSQEKRFLWMILQDLFFETAGVNSILNEFVTGELE